MTAMRCARHRGRRCSPTARRTTTKCARNASPAPCSGASPACSSTVRAGWRTCRATVRRHARKLRSACCSRRRHSNRSMLRQSRCRSCALRSWTRRINSSESTMNRRAFLKAAALGASAGAFQIVFPGASVAWAAPVSGRYDKLLVLIELKGGNDGLNTLVPYADPAYYALRPKLAISRDAVLQLTDRAALHPSLSALLPLWKDRQMAVLQGVGY